MERARSIEVITERATRDSYRAWRAGRIRAAVGYLEEALEVDPLCREALVALGDLYNFDGDQMGLSEQQYCEAAIVWYDRAIAAWPDHSEAYAEKALCLLDLGRFQDALDCAETGFRYLETRPTKDLAPDVWVNVAESLYARKATALKKLGRREEGRRILMEGLSRFPESTYLTEHIDEFRPEL